MSLKGKLSALRFGRGGRQHALTSAGVIVAAVVVVSLLTWLNDAHKPIVHSIEEAVGHSLPETLEQVDDQVATLFGVDEESVRSVREGLIGLVTSRPESLYEIATGRPLSTNSTAPASADFPAPSMAAPASGEFSPAATNASPPQTTSEPLPATDAPPATSEPALPPTTDTPPPATEEPSLPPLEEPSPPVTEEPPPATDEPALPKGEPSPSPAKGEQPPATKTSPVPTKGTGG